MLTTKQAADALGVSSDKILSLIASGHLAAMNINPDGGRPTYRIDPAEIDGYKSRNSTGPPPKRQKRETLKSVSTKKKKHYEKLAERNPACSHFI